MGGETRQDVARIGVLLAAGRGSRMGRTKQLVLWSKGSGSEPLVAAAFDAIACVCREVVVVLGHDAEAVTAALAGRAFHPATSDPDAAMFASVRAGLEAARKIDPQADVLLQPADHPAVRRETLVALIRVAGDHRDCAIMPVYRGKGGHPVLIPAGLIDHVLDYDGHGGLRQFWQEQPALCLRLVVSDASVVEDLDTPADLYRSAGPEDSG